MGQLTQRVVLIHELGQLGGTEEFLHGSGHRFDVDQRLGRNSLQILGGHTLPDNSLQTGKTDPVLVLQQLTDCTDTTVAQMVDVVLAADAILQMHVIVNGSKNVFLGDMLRNELMDILVDCSLDILKILIFFQYFSQSRVVY